MSEPTIIIWIGFGAVLLGAGVMTSSAFQLVRALRCRGWERCEGEVLETEIRRLSGGSKGDGMSASSGPSYLPVIRYRYTWRGREFEGDRRTFGDFGASHDRAEKIVARYRAGQRVEVFVNPMQPEMAVLETRLTWGLLLPALIAAFFIIGGLITLWRGGD